MINRGLFVHAVSKLEYEDGRLKLDFWASEINHQNKAQAFKDFSNSPYDLAVRLNVQKYENFSERLTGYIVTDGKVSSPSYFVIQTDNSSLNFSTDWFAPDSPIKIANIVPFMQDLKDKGKIEALVDIINYLSHGY